MLLARKGGYSGYAAMLVAEATGVSELPQTYVKFLLEVHNDLTRASNAEGSQPAADTVASGANTRENTSAAETVVPDAADSRAAVPGAEAPQPNA